MRNPPAYLSGIGSFGMDYDETAKKEISVQEAHAIGHAVKDRLIAEIVTVRDVLVHIEPFRHG
jgi:divalent metal cation (Fe/Co/Zn/Cd) transporter